MSAVESQKIADGPAAGHVEPAPAPVEPVHIDKPVDTISAPETEQSKTEGETVAPLEEKKKEEKPEVKTTEPIYSGALGYKAPGLKNAFRFSKKYFWFGEEPVPASNLREYLRGEKPEVAHSVAAWSSQTGKGLLYFVKHADQKEHPAGVLNLAYTTDLVKDGTHAFAFKISGHKHAFEAQSAHERDGWYVAFEKAISEAKAAKEGIESSEGYKEQKDKIGKPTTLAAATASTSAPKKSIETTPALASTEAPAGEGAAVAAPARAGSSSSSSSNEEKKAKKAKSKSRSASRGKRNSLFGSLLGKKDKLEEKVEPKKHDHKDDSEVAKAEPEVKKDETPVVAPAPETTTTAPVIIQDIPKPSEELKTEATPAPLAAGPLEGSKAEETPLKTTEEKPKPAKRGSIFGAVFNKLSSPTSEKKEADAFPAPAKGAEPVSETSKPLEEAHVAVPATLEPASEPAAPKSENVKPSEKPSGLSTPSKEKEHFSFGKFFGGGGSKDRAKSPSATEKAPAHHEPAKVDAVAPQIQDTSAPTASEPAEPIVAAPVIDSKAEPVASDVKKEETPVKKEKRGSIFATLGRSLSKATNKPKDTTPKEKKEAPITVAESTEENKTAAPLGDKKDETPAVQSIGDVVPEAVTAGEAPKSNPAVASTA